MRVWSSRRREERETLMTTKVSLSNNRHSGIKTVPKQNDGDRE